ncbi:MAG: hypothetical protein PHR98_02060 [Candidatus Shapirobacteria bacterium]|nr:hypothetical protein [Candidatus Shapirobacteria bacterium]
MSKTIEVSDKIFGMDKRIFSLWLEPFALFLIMFMSIFMLIVPKINEGLARLNENKSVLKKTAQVNEKITYLQTIDQDQIQKDAQKLASGLLPEKSSYILLKVIQNTAQKLNYNIDDFSISMGDVKDEGEENMKTTSFDKIPIQVNLIGPVDNYLTLAKVLERSLPIMSISKYEMSSIANEVTTIKLAVNAYYMKEVTNFKLENISLADLTLSQAEADLLATIGEYNELDTKSIEGVGESGTFIKYDRVDPFFTP